MKVRIDEQDMEIKFNEKGNVWLYLDDVRILRPSQEVLLFLILQRVANIEEDLK